MVVKRFVCKLSRISDNRHIMDWQKIILPPSASEIPVPVGITNQFEVLFNHLSQPKGFCVFLSVREDGRTLYLSPVAKEHSAELVGQFRRYYEVDDCDAPSGEALQLEVGDFKTQDCLDLLK